jgi:hypothetical protein
MKTRVIATTVTLLALVGVASPALATTIDFTGAGAADYDVVSQSYGDSAEADLSYRTLQGGNNWGQTATQSENFVYYWADANYSQDQAIFAAHQGEKQELALQAGSGLRFTSVTFDLGSYPNVTKDTAFKLFDASWNELLSNSALSIDASAGALITLAVNTSALYFQMGDNWNNGIRSVSFATAPAAVAQTPIPAALPLFLSALGVLGFAARRRKLA